MNTNNEKVFEELQSDFYHYMVNFGGIMPKTSRDYVTRLKFLSARYCLDKNITNEYITYILSEEEKVMGNRSIYSTRHALADFKSGLRKFMSFVQSDFHKRYEDSVLYEIDKVQQSHYLTTTEKTSIMKSRIGQGLFRKELVSYWKGCAVSGFDIVSVLVASHIKPWRVSNNEERLDMFNGLLLLPNYDKLFDLGYVTFNKKGEMIYSKLLPISDRKIIGLGHSIRLQKLEERHKSYLKYHNEYCFMG